MGHSYCLDPTIASRFAFSPQRKYHTREHQNNNLEFLCVNIDISDLPANKVALGVFYSV